MQDIQERACLAANRVDVAVGFVTGATSNVASCILDAFHATQSILLELSQSGLLDEFFRFLTMDSIPLVDRDSRNTWPEFVSSQIKLLQAARLNQKTIEITGDLLADWTPHRVNGSDLDGALSCLEYMVMLEAENLAKAWALDEARLSSRMQSLSLILAGIAAITANNSVSDNSEAITGVSFGASLVVDHTARISA